MGITINTNQTSLDAQRNLGRTQSALSANVSRLSSGQRINSASDDAAGLGISETLKSNLRGVAAASRNILDGTSAVQAVDEGLAEASSVLLRMRELAVNAASDNTTTIERDTLGQAASALAEELNRINKSTSFNGRAVFGASSPLDFQVGVSSTDTVRLDTRQTRVSAAALGVDAINLQGSPAQARDALKRIDAALQSVSDLRAGVSGTAKQLSAARAVLGQEIASTAGTEGNIRDADFAYETSQLVKIQILQQAGVSVLAQANQLNQGALSLLR